MPFAAGSHSNSGLPSQPSFAPPKDEPAAEPQYVVKANRTESAAQLPVGLLIGVAAVFLVVGVVAAILVMRFMAG